MELIGKANKNCDTLFLVDTRPMVSFLRLFNAKLISYSFSIDGFFVMGLKAWEHAYESISCVVHCSDGWDRTAQTVSLAQLLLDPFFRTIHGFQVLIEKDWLGFGHKFDDRCAHIGALNDEAAKEVSPIFSQFLDCVHQIMKQRPRAFQFNDRYLIDIHEHVYSCQFGTFIGNCEKDRKDLHIEKRTKSLWTYLDHRQDDYLNPFYERVINRPFQPTTFGVLSGIETRAAAFKRVINRPFQPTTFGVLSGIETRAAAFKRIAELKCQLGRGGTCCGNSMADSGHSSGTGQSEERLASDQRPSSRESGISLSYSEEVLTRLPVRWQSLRDASHCTSKSCRAEFASAVDRRIHCHRCGKVRTLDSSISVRQCLQCFCKSCKGRLERTSFLELRTVFCRRCVRVTADERERICEGCRAIC
ncbi:unnamed protein product [Strongylus vulgaris]|uniref:Myotubularin phosphatase domain-containing protein n=1 Tax=Strongylus vulgaris TaxID=40348 RepID=A0A3P7LG06_STRVU|nr:unnamed protein product [Strongylus vulgaris]